MPKFEGKKSVPTFNLNGDRKGGMNFINAHIQDRRFVGKNVCHTVEFNKKTFEWMSKPRDRSSELFMQAMKMYLERHDLKKFHDPTAAVCHLHPEVAKWVRGDVGKMGDGWGTVVSETGGSLVAADLDYDMLWNRLTNWS